MNATGVFRRSLLLVYLVPLPSEVSVPPGIEGRFLGMQLSHVSISTSAQGTTTTQIGDNYEMTIRVHNYARVPPSVLRQAEQAASSVLHESGVHAVWVECATVPSASTEAACSRPVTPLVLLLNLLPEPMARRLKLHSDAFGVAAESSEKGFSFLGSVFYDRVKDCADHERVDLVPLLGSVMAHELGHLLLGTDSHSPSGIMCASWSGKQIHDIEQRGLSFSTSEAKQLQTAVKVRGQAAMFQQD
jgi:hypothetical protein